MYINMNVNHKDFVRVEPESERPSYKLLHFHAYVLMWTIKITWWWSLNLKQPPTNLSGFWERPGPFGKSCCLLVFLLKRLHHCRRLSLGVLLRLAAAPTSGQRQPSLRLTCCRRMMSQYWASTTSPPPPPPPPHTSSVTVGCATASNI